MHANANATEDDHGHEHEQRDPTQAPTTTTADFAAELRANIANWYRQENTPECYAAFGARNRATWIRIAAVGAEVNDEVLRILRERR